MFEKQFDLELDQSYKVSSQTDAIVRDSRFPVGPIQAIERGKTD
jgi:hypothetical protein